MESLLSPKTISANLKSFIAILFIISGATGLIYQVVWFKYLGIFLGNTTYAQMIVLSAFLGGLALGNNFAGKIADKLKNPLLVYSSLEFFIGLYCFAYPFLSSLAGNVFVAVGRSGDLTDTGGFIFTGVRTVLAVSLLILPTMAMGATLPTLSKAFINDLKSSQRDMAVLYGLNSLGAVFGILYSGFFLINYFGLDNTLYISASINLALGISGAIVALTVKTQKDHTREIESDENESVNHHAAPVSDKLAFMVVLIAGTSGFAALLYEMVWVRLLIHVFGSSTYAFSIMLMAFISGITIGSIIAASKLFRNMNKLHVVAFSQAAIALSTLPVLLIYDRLLYVIWVLASYMQKNDATFTIYLAAEFILCFLTIVIPTIFMGITLPVIVSIVAEKKNAIGASVGRVFSVNTLGTVLGSILTGLVFIPWLGMRGSFELGMFVNLAGAALLLFSLPTWGIKRRLISLGTLTCIFLAIIIFTPSWNIKLTLASVFRQTNSLAPASFADFNKMLENRKVLFYKEGTHANVSVVQYLDTTHTRVLIINGKADASNGNDMATQVLLGQIPMLLHNDPKEVFVVGLGSGVTVGSVLTHPVANVHCAEIAQEVIEAAPFFSKENNDCLNDPRLHMHIEDAHTYLKLSPKLFDVIVSEPSNPWIAGIGNLFSKEYFELCKSKLQKNGIMVQWFHVYEMDNDIVRLVMNTFASVFPYTQLWNSADGDIIMVGAEKEIKIDEDKLIAKVASEKVSRNLAQVKISNAFTFLSTQMLGTDGFYATSMFDEINTERHPLLEFRAPRSLYMGKSAGMIFEQDDRYMSFNSGLYSEGYVQRHQPDSTQLNNAITFHYHVSRMYKLAYSLSSYALNKYPADYTATRYKLYTAEQLPAFRTRAGLIDNFNKKFSEMPIWKSVVLSDKLKEELQATSFMGRQNIDRFVEEIVSLLPELDSLTQTRYLMEITNAYMKNGEPEMAVIYAKKAQVNLSASAKNGNGLNLAEFIYNAALSAAYTNDYKLTIEYIMAMMSYYPKYENKSYLLRKTDRILK